MTKIVTATVTVKLAHDGRLALDGPLADQFEPELFDRWRTFDVLPRITPRQLLAHTSGLPNYFTEEALSRSLRETPSRARRPVDLVDLAGTQGPPRFLPGEGFSYSDTGYVIAGMLVEHATGRPLQQVYRELVFEPFEMTMTWLEGDESARATEVAHRSDLARFVRGLWSERIVDRDGLREMTSWTPGVWFPPGHALRYGLGTGSITVEGVELRGHTGFIGAFAFHAPEYDAILVGTHNASQVDRWPLVAALCRELQL